MGKKSKKQNEDKQEISTENQTSVANNISKVPKRIKKSKSTLDLNNTESNENSVIKDKKCEIVDGWNVSTIPNSLIPGDTSNIVEAKYEGKKKKKRKQIAIQDEIKDEKLSTDKVVNSDKQKSKKIKLNIPEVNHIEHSSENSSVAKKRKKIKQENLFDEGNNDQSRKEILNVNSKTIKKKPKQNILHNEVQEAEQKTNDEQEKPKKKKKRKIIPEEVIDEEEIDRFCDGLDDFHNKQFDNWVKLIEENLNKDVRKYVVF